MELGTMQNDKDPEDQLENERRLIAANDQIDTLFKFFLVLCVALIPSAFLCFLLPAYLLSWVFFLVPLSTLTVERLRLKKLCVRETWKLGLMWLVVALLFGFLFFSYQEGYLVS